MIREHVLLPVLPGREKDFEAAFAEAKQWIAGSPGFRGLTLASCLERPGSYLLLVDWERLEDHTKGFRGSPAYEQWRQLLHPFYAAPLEVLHFQHVQDA